ncbi:DUF1353 domain-containing protein [Roseovarius sp. D0-M9]|uniref:DUF1353 domain-containing protein n=1 Tax=Roseovarius sp. D0-M9 TaxID=3127117 RepID=UPI003010003A
MSDYTSIVGWCEPIGGIRYRSRRDLKWAVGHPRSGFVFVVPAGRVFDVSIPRALRWIFDPHDPRFLKAAALHDEMLMTGWARVTAAAEFHEALRADGVGRWARLAMFGAVALWRFQ